MDKPSFFEYKKNQNNKKKKSSKNFLDDENGLYSNYKIILSIIIKFKKNKLIIIFYLFKC